ncbi:MAG: bifunctional (p)ppGpp synthetase/guanosine-3',5'-bis(diphosphate) 3'-pyrophosphohydrolase [Oscillospiraceae bacterium]|nr:bifunctional (p)ppGpp synthetase/guanosine-3',5'-bis(diphosphate) 3'-pyrophosphohydrolase [Oscillospiraceae bacterium]MBQ3048515.1 bifunctional (p)ppGpp synthetase/guanosine-3',5'-bis(diphosphate) 3'-pyrophosphohydrolase [Oscillospiraceae bacterium]MBQ9938816.1 bifunctional (p)ppGpp synthetase/guanosine-3',5'-bis(diphosphate) 3'-pyrophosphohydrolase [Oscillospiraceae bacterium]
MENLYSKIEAAMEKSGKQYDKELIRAAYDLAEKSHEGQLRQSGEPYITHPVAVTLILIEYGMDSETIAAALLHDVVEDTGVTLEEVTKQFGNSIALLVDGVTKLTKMSFSTKEEQQAENVRKMLLAMAQDVRVIIIKLADRLHNMRTMKFKSDIKQRQKALETMEVYAPLAHRLGIRAIKEELEDTAIEILDPIAYAEIEEHINMEKSEMDNFIKEIKEKISARLGNEFENVYVEGRVKSVYGIYRKVYMGGRDFESVYDIYAVRVIVNSVTECYSVLGMIHDMFTLIPNRFKDYISTPKQNMYQSLHTTVMDKSSSNHFPFEVQIRTWEMHHTAEYGIAAHWKYKAGVSGNDKLDERLEWVRKMLEAQKESDATDLVRSIKSDLSPDEVFVYTPKGDVKSLPAGATVIDFAYAIHTQVGNRMVGAKVDGRMVSLDFRVKTGMIVEIITSSAKDRGPSRDWLNIVQTGEARSKIRAWFKKERREENIAQGKEDIEREFKRNNIVLSEEEYAKFIDEVARRQKFPSTEEFYAAIGYGGIALSKIIPRIKDDYQKAYKTDEAAKLEKAMAKNRKEKKTSSGVIIEELDECLVKFARCCNPLPGDDIVGFVTRGYGVSVHKRECVNVINAINSESTAGRWVNARWDSAQFERYMSAIEISANDRDGLLADVSIALLNMKIPIHTLNAKECKDGMASIKITIEVGSLEQLTKVMDKFKAIRGVISVERCSQ